MRRISLVLVLALLFSMCISLSPPASAGSHINVTVSEAKTLIDSNPSLVILDVRTQSEYNDDGHIRNAKLIPLSELEGRLDELNKTDEILVYCKSGGRSSTASQILADNSFLHVYNMSGGIVNWISAGNPVFIKYSSIQEAVNNATTGDTLFVSSGVYNENLVVNKSLSLIGENTNTTIIDSAGIGNVVSITVDNVSISSFTMQKSGCGCASNGGILIDNHPKNVTITHNLITQNGFGVLFHAFARNATVASNIITNNNYDGVYAYLSFNITIFGNKIANNRNGINLLFTNDTTISSNILTNNNACGIYSANSSNNLIFHNNVINNHLQIYSSHSTNTWDNGFEGNYWSDYEGIDTDHDGIGENWYEIDQSNIDHNPLMGMFHSFNASVGHQVDASSNSTISYFEYFETNSTVRMHVSNKTENQTWGFCRICIPHVLMEADGLTVVIDDGMVEALYFNNMLHDNGTHRWIYFAYTHSKHEVVIIPEINTFTIWLLALLPLSALTFRKCMKHFHKPPKAT